jgi:hypothetical protein
LTTSFRCFRAAFASCLPRPLACAAAAITSERVYQQSMKVYTVKSRVLRARAFESKRGRNRVKRKTRREAERHVQLEVRCSSPSPPSNLPLLPILSPGHSTSPSLSQFQIVCPLYLLYHFVPFTPPPLSLLDLFFSLLLTLGSYACHVSRVTCCNLSRVTCHVQLVTCVGWALHNMITRQLMGVPPRSACEEATKCARRCAKVSRE